MTKPSINATGRGGGLMNGNGPRGILANAEQRPPALQWRKPAKSFKVRVQRNHLKQSVIPENYFFFADVARLSR
jgi:hypothetical protein